MDFLLSAEYQQYYLIFVACAITSYGAVEVLKLFINNYIQYKKITPEPWWHKPICRFLSILFGLGVGILLGSSPIEYAIGASAGVLNTFVVMFAKQYFKKKIGSE